MIGARVRECAHGMRAWHERWPVTVMARLGWAWAVVAEGVPTHSTHSLPPGPCRDCRRLSRGVLEEGIEGSVDAEKLALFGGHDALFLLFCGDRVDRTIPFLWRIQPCVFGG